MLSVEYAYLRALDSERGINSANVLSPDSKGNGNIDPLGNCTSAHAKCRASRSVDKDDAEAAIRLMRFAHFGMEGSHCEGGEEEDGGERGNDGNVEVEVESGEDAEAGVQEVEENDPEGNYKLLVSSLAR